MQLRRRLLVDSILLPVGSLFIFLLSLMGCNDKAEAPLAYDGSYARLIKEAKVPPKFSAYRPDFHAEEKVFDFIGKEGPYLDTIWVIMDGDKYVALYFAQNKPYLDVFAANPDVAPTTLEMPVRHHNATLLGTRLTTSAWYDQWALSGDQHYRSFEGGGDSLMLVETQQWDQAGHYHREAISSHQFTFKVDPYLGYVVEANCQLQTNDSTKKQIEFMNFMPRDAVNPWPDRQLYSHTVFTPAGDSTYMTYANNLLAGNLADETKTDWGKGFEVGEGGFVGMAGYNQYSPLLFRWGNVRFVHRTCDAWLDLHQHVLLPGANKNGEYNLETTYLFAHVPPAISAHILDNKTLMSFERASGVMIPLGVKEDFEHQPKPIEHIGIGLTKGFWEKDFTIDSINAFSGRKSMRLEASTGTQATQTKSGFIRYPQVPLSANTTYQLEVMAKVSSSEAQGWIEAATYEWTPYDTVRLTRNQTEMVSDTSWQRLSLQFTTPDYDPFVDLRFRAKGTGTLWFDDFFFGPVVD